MRFLPGSFAVLALLASVAGCGDDGAETEDPNEVITTVILTFTPSGGAAITATWLDADGDGGGAPVIDPVNLAADTTYAATVRFQNALEDPPEEITEEVMDEGFQHQVFWTGTAVDGPASDQPDAPLHQTYGDTDENGLPIGLTNSVGTTAGTGQLTITLRHMPPINGTAVKVAGTSAQVKSDGINSIGGSSDASVSFDVTVAAP